MRNLIKNVADTLRPILKVQPEFPTATSALPTATINEVYNGQLFTVDGVEWESEISLQVDIWAETLQNCDELALRADAAMRSNGWIRDTVQNFVENGTYRKSLRYSIKIINLDKEN